MSNKENYIYRCYMRLLELYDYLEAYEDDATALIELNALELICRIYKEEIEAMGLKQ